MTALQTVAKEWAKSGWSIRSIDDAQFIAARKKGPSGLLIVVGLLLTPVLIGLLLIALAFLARGEVTQVVTIADADIWLAQRTASQEQLARAAEENSAAQEKRVEARRARAAQATGVRRLWLSTSPEVRILVGVAAYLIIQFAILGVIN